MRRAAAFTCQLRIRCSKRLYPRPAVRTLLGTAPPLQNSSSYRAFSGLLSRSFSVSVNTMGTGGSKEGGSRKGRLSLGGSRKKGTVASGEVAGETAGETAGAGVVQQQQQEQQQQEQPEQGGGEATVQSKETEEQGGAGTKEQEEDDFVEAVVANVSEFGDNEMKEVDLADSKVLLIRQNDRFSAIGHKCSHYGAPLAKGVLSDGHVRCPWHGACFNVGSGDIEEFPGLDGVGCFQVSVAGDEVTVRADKKALASAKKTAKMTLAAPTEDKRTFLIVGGGPASVTCAESLRQEGFKGQIVLACKETTLPYDRPKLSKAMHLTAEAISLRPSDFYSAHDIQLMLGKEATGVDVEEKKVWFGESESIAYDTLMLATGSKPRTLPIPGFDLENVFLLREPAHANIIAEKAAGKKVVVIGTSFIGMEVASYLSDKATSISCIDLTAVPFERVLGTKIGLLLQQMCEENGVKFYLNAGVKEIVGEEGKVVGVTLPSGETLECDVCVAGVGVVPVTDYLKGSSLPLSNRGELIVDEHMRAVEGVYGAGDIVRFPLPLVKEDANIGHWQLAHNHGRVAARNMLGKEEAFNSIPFFWTVLFGKSLRYCGFALSWDEIIYDGSPEDRSFAAFFVKDDQVLAAASLNRDPAVSSAAELMARGAMPTGTQIKENMNLKSYL